MTRNANLYQSVLQGLKLFKNSLFPINIILGDLGATSRDDAIFSGERKFISRAEEPLGTFYYQTSSRSVEIRLADWQEKYFSGQSLGDLAG